MVYKDSYYILLGQYFIPQRSNFTPQLPNKMYQ